MKLADDEREVLLAELEQALATAEEPRTRAVLEQLRECAAAGEIPEELTPHFTSLVETGLSTGLIRKNQSPHAEMTALRFYRRTPRGASIQQSLDAVSEALSGLAGQRLEEVTLSLAGPGAFTLAIGTDQGRMLVRLDQGGAELRSVEVG